MQYYMRWAYYYPQTQRFGVWSRSTADVEVDAINQCSTDGLVRAEIQSKPIGGDGVIRRVYICPGDEFQEFQWLGQVRQSITTGGTSEPEIVGLRLKKKDGSIKAFYKDGTFQEESK